MERTIHPGDRSPHRPWSRPAFADGPRLLPGEGRLVSRFSTRPWGAAP